MMDGKTPISYEPDALPRKEDLRDSGIDIIGAVPWGTHFCQFYATRQDLVESLVPYFKAGLDANEFCMWVTSAPLQVAEAVAALRESVPQLNEILARGQIEILDYSQWYTPTGRFDAAAVLQGWSDKLAAARRRGFDGLRLTGNTFWLEKSDWDDFTRYEEMINQVIGGQRMIALCTYSLEKCGAREIMDVISNHQFALIKNGGQWDLIESSTNKKMEQNLRESEERLRLAVWAAELGVFEWDVLTDHPVWENQRMYEIFGRIPEMGPINKAELMEQIIHPEDAETLEAALNESMQPGRLFHAACRIRRCNDGEQRWIEFSGQFKHDDHGRALRLTGVLEDITERKQYEETLRENASQLEQLNRELENFAYIASHDLKEPLRKISAFGERLKMHAGDKLDQNERDYLERMTGGAARMQAMIDKLLAYSRVTTQAEPPCRTDLSQVAAEMLSDLEMFIEQNRGKVELDPLPVIEADPVQMRQLLQNLISNGIKFHKPDERPMVRVHSRNLPGFRVEITVEDNGIGFDMEQARTLFQPFRRLVGRSEFEGTGIGLAICRKIVDHHRGTITAHSAPGQGATFIVTLPARQPRVVAD